MPALRRDHYDMPPSRRDPSDFPSYRRDPYEFPSPRRGDQYDMRPSRRDSYDDFNDTVGARTRRREDRSDRVRSKRRGRRDGQHIEDSVIYFDNEDELHELLREYVGSDDSVSYDGDDVASRFKRRRRDSPSSDSTDSGISTRQRSGWRR